MKMDDRVLTLRFRPSELEKWMHQNKAQHTGACVEGCLLDNFVLACKRGFAAVYERYVNEWTSEYRVEFEQGAALEVWRRWYEFEERSKQDGKKYA